MDTFPGRKLNAVDYLDYGIEFYKKNFKKILLVMLFYYIPITLIANYLMDAGSILRIANGTYYNNLALPVYIKFILGYGISLVYGLIFSPAFGISIIYYTYRKIRFGEDPKPKRIVKYGFSKFGWVLLMMMVFTQGITLIIYAIIIPFELLMITTISRPILVAIVVFGIIALVVGVYFYVRLYFAECLIALKNKNCFTALSASWKYTKGKAWIVFKTIFWKIILVTMLPGVFTAVGAIISVTSITASSIISSVLTTIGAMATPVSMVIDTVIFISVEHEIGEDEKEDKYVEFFEERGISV